MKSFASDRKMIKGEKKAFYSATSSVNLTKVLVKETRQHMKTFEVKQTDGQCGSDLDFFPPCPFVKGNYRVRRESEDDTELRRKEGPTCEA